jgi:hypothetical protein
LTTRAQHIPPALLVAALAVVVGAAGPAALAAAPRLGHPGYVILGGAADTTGIYRWRPGPGPGQRSLVWPQGVLTLPAEAVCESFGPTDLAVAVTADLEGVGGGGVLAFAEGRYEISAPLHLSDGRIRLSIAAGELEIRDGRLRYTPPAPAARTRDARSGLLLLAGMIILVAVTLRLARRRSAVKDAP